LFELEGREARVDVPQGEAVRKAHGVLGGHLPASLQRPASNGWTGNNCAGADGAGDITLVSPVYDSLPA
jgi:hypothetical protein